MLSKSEIEAFAMKELPWIANATGMKWDGTLPQFHALTRAEMSKLSGGDNSCYMAYEGMLNRVIYCSDTQFKRTEVNELQWFKSALIHELVHFLQVMNEVQAKPSQGISALVRIENEAYTTQANWLWCRLGIDPAIYKLDAKGIKMGVIMSTIGTLRVSEK